MQNEPDLNAAWPELRERASARLQPDLAGRVQSRLLEQDAQPAPSRALALSLGTALACCALSFCIASYNTQRASSSAMEQWAAFDSDDADTLAELTP